MDKTVLASQIAAAKVLGAKAFADGRPLIPCYDAHLSELIGKNPAGESIPVIEAWTQAWINAPIPEPV